MISEWKSSYRTFEAMIYELYGKRTILHLLICESLPYINSVFEIKGVHFRDWVTRFGTCTSVHAQKFQCIRTED